MRTDDVRGQGQLDPVRAREAVREPGAGVVDEDVQYPELVAYGRGERADRRLVGDVDGQSRALVGRADLGRRDLATLQRARAHDDVGAELDQPARDLLTDSPGCSRDYC